MAEVHKVEVETPAGEKLEGELHIPDISEPEWPAVVGFVVVLVSVLALLGLLVFVAFAASLVLGIFASASLGLVVGLLLIVGSGGL